MLVVERPEAMSEPPRTASRSTCCASRAPRPWTSRVVFDRNRVTGAGVSAGLDMGLAMVDCAIASMRRRCSCWPTTRPSLPPTPVRPAPRLPRSGNCSTRCSRDSSSGRRTHCARRRVEPQGRADRWRGASAARGTTSGCALCTTRRPRRPAAATSRKSPCTDSGRDEPVLLKLTKPADSRLRHDAPLSR